MVVKVMTMQTISKRIPTSMAVQEATVADLTVIQRVQLTVVLPLQFLVRRLRQPRLLVFRLQM
jgi:hypothetical protein